MKADEVLRNQKKVEMAMQKVHKQGVGNTSLG